MNYRPKGMWVWDPWCVADGAGTVHLFHLQQHERPEDGDWNLCPMGHAVSNDLLHWKELPSVLPPSEAVRDDDDRQAWTGCAIPHNGRINLFYTMRGSASDGRIQAIGLARSEDGVHFERYSGNPVLRPDPRWYCTAAAPTPGVVDCRDMMVIPAPDRPGWYGYFATRRPGADQGEAAAIGLAWSPDLIRWEQQPPVFASTRHACVEVPDVFELDGRWYLICLTGMVYGSLNDFTEPEWNFGTVYAVADSPRGPFVELADNSLIGTARMGGPLSLRHLEFEGGLYCMYTDRENLGRVDHADAHLGTLTTPKLLRTNGDRLELAYCDRVEQLVKREIPVDPERLRQLVGEDYSQIWPMRPLPVEFREDGAIGLERRNTFRILPLGVAGVRSYIFEVDVTLQDAASGGVAVRMAEDPRADCDLIRLDRERGKLQFLGFRKADYSERCTIPFEAGCEYRLRVVARHEHIELYIDDRLCLCVTRYRCPEGGLGLFTERGRTVFRNLRIRELDIPGPASGM